MSRRALPLVVAVLLVAGAAACGTDDEAASPATTAPPAAGPTVPAASAGCDAAPPTATGTHERVDLDVDGTTRWYTRYVPASGAAGTTPQPVVIDLHGYLSGSAGQAAISELATTADAEGFVVVTPQGNGDLPYWNAVPHDDLPDDIAFLAAVIDDVAATTCTDPGRVYVDGFSNGAFLASLVACELSDRVAAVAAVAGLQEPAGCDPARPVPVLAIHGTDDRYVSVDGGANPALDELTWDAESTRAFEGLPFAPVADSAAGWAARNGCDPDPTVTEVAPSVARTTYEGCDDDATVELYLVAGGGHTWPGSAFSAASADTLGPTTDEIDANGVIWSFFADHPMPGASAGVVPTAVQELEIDGTEYAFTISPDGGADLTAGWTRIRFHNRGVEAHQVMFAALKPGVDVAELAAAAGGDSSGSAAIAFVDMLGGVSYIGPGQSIEAMVELPEGIVLAMCYVPDHHGVAHALSGMSTTLAVGPPAAPAEAATGPAEPVRGTITMGPDGYDVPQPLTAGWYRVVNDDGGADAGEGLHELAILGLDSPLDGDDLDGLLDDLATNATPEVELEALGGMGALSGGFAGYLYLDLPAGPYLAVDFMPDPGDPRPHLLDGYVTGFEV